MHYLLFPSGLTKKPHYFRQIQTAFLLLLPNPPHLAASSSCCLLFIEYHNFRSVSFQFNVNFSTLILSFHSTPQSARKSLTEIHPLKNNNMTLYLSTSPTCVKECDLLSFSKRSSRKSFAWRFEIFIRLV